VHAEAHAVVGRRVEPGGRVVYYERADAELGAHLGLAIGALEEHGAAELGIEVTVERGRATLLRLRSAALVHGDLAPAGPATLGDLAAVLRSRAPQSDGNGRRAEIDVTLDLTKPENRRAVLGFLEIALPGLTPGGWHTRVRELGRRLDVDGAVDVRLFRVGLDERDVGVEAALLGGAGYDRTVETRELLRAWSLPPGGTLHEREDCIPA
jgi:hypothetical protein